MFSTGRTALHGLPTSLAKPQQALPDVQLSASALPKNCCQLQGPCSSILCARRGRCYRWLGRSVGPCLEPICNCHLFLSLWSFPVRGGRIWELFLRTAANSAPAGPLAFALRSAGHTFLCRSSLPHSVFAPYAPDVIAHTGRSPAPSRVPPVPEAAMVDPFRCVRGKPRASCTSPGASALPIHAGCTPRLPDRNQGWVQLASSKPLHLRDIQVATA